MMGEAAGSDSTLLRRRVPRSTQAGEEGGAKEDWPGTRATSSASEEDAAVFPPATWTFNREGFPQAVAHRGYKAEFPENTMGAFRGAVEVGAHAIETDVHLSKDDVVVIAHDKDLKRCYGEDALVRDRDWAHLSTLRTLREPRQPMPRLADLLAYLAEPGRESVWLLLDIKIDDPAPDMVARLADVLLGEGEGEGPASSPWRRRVVLGCWTAAHLRLCRERLPGFAVAWIGITTPLAREYLRVPNVALNMRQESLYGAGGRCLVRECQARARPLYAWTVNGEGWMRWAVAKRLDAVVTDDPRKYLEVCERYRREEEEGGRRAEGVLATVRGFLLSLCLPVLINVATRTLGYYRRVGTPAEVREALRDLGKV